MNVLFEVFIKSLERDVFDLKVVYAIWCEEEYINCVTPSHKEAMKYITQNNYAVLDAHFELYNEQTLIVVVYVVKNRKEDK